jgi:hypothetical protein
VAGVRCGPMGKVLSGDWLTVQNMLKVVRDSEAGCQG